MRRYLHVSGIFLNFKALGGWELERVENGISKKGSNLSTAQTVIQEASHSQFTLALQT